MKKKIRLLIVGAFPPKNLLIYGGIITTCKTLLESDFPNHFDLILIDSTQRSNPAPGIISRILFAITRFSKFLHALFTKNPNAILLFTALGASVLEKGTMAKFARFLNIPVFIFPRGGELIEIINKSWLQRLLLIPALQNASFLLCQGDVWHRFATDVLGYPKSRAPIIHNWSATPELLNIGAERQNSIDNPITKVLFIGWLEKEKGIFDLLRACQILFKDHQFLLTIAGSGHAEREAKAFVVSNSLNEKIRFVGWVQGDNKINLLRNSDILVLPSWAEGFPNAVIEAMAAKLAVVVTNVGNIPSLINDRHQALLIPPNNVDAIVGALNILLIDPPFRYQLAAQGYEFAKNTFSTEAGVSKLSALIKQSIVLD